ncbi:MAG: YHS domain-containing protein [Alphaproteobacteria bacterium]|nr:YHS domain-containing protein [Alphaproteobacteria bacterium]
MLKLRIFILLSLFLSASVAHALDPVYKSSSGKGAGGYDVVAYFDQSQPVKGDSDYQTQWNGADWLFSSAENLKKFTANPEKYAPQYGGYCAWAVSQNYTARGSPKHWNIVDDKLYLNYNGSVKLTWQRNARKNIVSGNKNWPNLLTSR